MWERDRRQKTATEFVDDVMEAGFSKEAVYRALSRPGNMSPEGVMDYDKVRF
jgi:DNA-binding phage protein